MRRRLIIRTQTCKCCRLIQSGGALQSKSDAAAVSQLNSLTHSHVYIIGAFSLTARAAKCVKRAGGLFAPSLIAFCFISRTQQICDENSPAQVKHRKCIVHMNFQVITQQIEISTKRRRDCWTINMRFLHVAVVN